MAESPVVTGLVGKRAEFAGRIEACRRELEQLEADVGHLDGAIRLFAPDYKLEGIRQSPLACAIDCSTRGNASAWSWRSSARPRRRCPRVASPRL